MTDPVELWIAALESGEYKQAQGRLRTNEGYCCLGVLCDVAKRQGVIRAYSAGGDYLPQSVKRWVGLNSVMGSYGSIGSLTLDNDVRGKSFTEIAAIIRSRPEGLFHD